jgi:hypothetical protein
MEEVRSLISLTRPLHEFLDLTPAMNPIILFYKVNIFLLLDKLLRKLFHALLRSGKCGRVADEHHFLIISLLSLFRKNTGNYWNK